MSIPGRLIVVAGLFLPSIAQAQATHHTEAGGLSCPGDQKVWVNTRTGVYHFQGERWYGNTRQGEYLCKKAADVEGDRETRNGQ